MSARYTKKVYKSKEKNETRNWLFFIGIDQNNIRCKAEFKE
jgi:hypothetical protein